jgi:hypothetical protein
MILTSLGNQACSGVMKSKANRKGPKLPENVEVIHGDEVLGGDSHEQKGAGGDM